MAGNPERNTAARRTRPARLTNVDAFFALNSVLFTLLCIFRYCDRFLHYRGPANIDEFLFYAATILASIGALWLWLRTWDLPAWMLGLLQFGILIHFAGAYVPVAGGRLYDACVLGIRYDKYVHFANAFIIALLVRFLYCTRARLDSLGNLFIVLIVLGLGAVHEISEYVVEKTVPNNGVGGYDNNMQDLVSNLVGASLCVLIFARRSLVLRRAESGAPPPGGA